MTPTPPRPAPVGAAEAAEQNTARMAAIERAYDMVVALCKPRNTPGARDWLMSIPADPARDPDIVIADGLLAGKQAVRDLAALAARADAATAVATTARALVAWHDEADRIARDEPGATAFEMFARLGENAGLYDEHLAALRAWLPGVAARAGVVAAPGEGATKGEGE